jgi:cellulose synthase/poly-beta-1,6-N-acetylglucosamine synthase-like glycosyltransferase
MSATSPPPTISVCIVTGRRSTMLEACLESVAAQHDPPSYEVLVVSTGDDGVADQVHGIVPDAVVARTGRALPGAARNLLLERARGQLLLFLDDDVTIEPEMFRRLADLAAAHPDVAVFGGPNETPPHSTPFQFVQGAVLASIVGSGPVRRRYGRHPASTADERWFILCNLAVRRVAMLPFADDLRCAEENEVLAQLHDRGLVMRYDPDLVVYHDRRPHLRSFAAQMRKYGFGRGQLMRRRPSVVQAPYLAPVALLAYLVLLPLLLFASPLAGLPALVYGAAVGAGSVRIAVSVKRVAAIPVAALLLVVVHACYGSGVAQGLAARRRPVAALEVEWVAAGERA